MVVKHRLPLDLVAGIEQALGLGFVFGAQAGLLAGWAVWDVKDPTTPEHRGFRFHGMIALNQATSPGATAFSNARSGKVSASFRQFWRVVQQSTALLIIPLTVAARPLKKPLICRGFTHLL